MTAFSEQAWHEDALRIIDQQSALINKLTAALDEAMKQQRALVVSHQATLDMASKDNAQMARLLPVLSFLMGEAELNGQWFGDAPNHWPMYWWRTELRKAMQ